MKSAWFFTFLLFSFGLTAAIFWKATTGASIMAPVDLAPALFSEYKFVDPSSSGIPENHYIIDQLTYDLPLQWTIYNAYRRHEIPWWDPYTYAGRPLLADAHINGTDPIRVVTYLVVPDFVLAYNFTALLKMVVSGIGMFLLLCHFRVPPLVSAGIGLAFQFSGAFAFFFGHPWIQGCFLYYPFLWIVLSSLASRLALTQNARSAPPLAKLFASWEVPTGGILIAGIFYSGNLQSHTYVALFLLAWLVGQWIGLRAFPSLPLFGVATMGVIGALLAAPVLLNQVEFYSLSTRPLSGSLSFTDCVIRGLLPMSSIFPWICGRFRTLDIGKIVELPGAGFQVYVGSALLVVALFGIFSGTVRRCNRPEWAACVTIWLGFLAICFTPAIAIFYTRLAPLPVMATCVLAGLTISNLPARPFRRTGIAIAAFGALVFATTNLGALAVYPHFKAQVRSIIEKKDALSASFPSAPKLRRAQLDRFEEEVGWRNPETVLAAAGIITAGAWLGCLSFRRRKSALAGMLALNLAPLLLFASSFVPGSPRGLFERLLAGGPAQQAVIQAAAEGRRVWEYRAGTPDAVFPNAFAHFYSIHVVEGYSALQPTSLFRWPVNATPPDPALLADVFVEKTGIRARSGKGTVRFACEPDLRDGAAVTRESLNELRLHNDSGSSLLRTDTWFPGWRLEGESPGIKITPRPPAFAMIAGPKPEDLRDLTLRYVPRFLSLGIALAALGTCLSVGMAFAWRFARVRQ